MFRKTACKHTAEEPLPGPGNILSGSAGRGRSVSAGSKGDSQSRASQDGRFFLFGFSAPFLQSIPSLACLHLRKIAIENSDRR